MSKINIHAIGAGFIFPIIAVTSVFVLTACYYALLPYMNKEIWFIWLVLFVFWSIGIPITYIFQTIARFKGGRNDN